MRTNSFPYRGFTLLEMLVVISMMLVLISTAAPFYGRCIVLAREAVLRQQLFMLRLIIGEYTVDKQRTPESLQDLTKDGYIKTLPTDPFTRTDESWVAEFEPNSSGLLGPGVVDVHSGAGMTSSDGTPYSSW